MKRLAVTKIKWFKKVTNTFLSFVLFATIPSCFNGYNDNEAKNKQPGFCGVDTNSDAEGMSHAPAVFKAKCSTCHYLNKDATGPKLMKILNRVPSEDWLRDFITNEDSLASIKDSATLEIQKISPTSGNHNFRSLTEKELEILIEYMK